MAEQIKFASSTAGDWQVLAIEGRIDTLTAQTAEQEALALLAAAQNLALELESLDYISSAGLRVLLRLAKEAQRSAKAFAIVGVQGLVKEVLAESGMDELFTTVDSVAEL